MKSDESSVMTQDLRRQSRRRAKFGGGFLFRCSSLLLCLRICLDLTATPGTRRTSRFWRGRRAARARRLGVKWCADVEVWEEICWGSPLYAICWCVFTEARLSLGKLVSFPMLFNAFFVDFAKLLKLRKLPSLRWPVAVPRSHWGQSWMCQRAHVTHVHFVILCLYFV